MKNNSLALELQETGSVACGALLLWEDFPRAFVGTSFFSLMHPISIGVCLSLERRELVEIFRDGILAVLWAEAHHEKETPFKQTSPFPGNTTLSFKHITV